MISRPLILAVVAGAGLAAIAWPAAPARAGAARGRDRDLVVLRSERWIDTVRGTLKSLAAVPAEEVVVLVKFRDRRKAVLGTETVTLGPLAPGEEREFQVAMPEKVRKATSWEITPRARWGASRR
jgi:hypothetical protein